jgi:GNAT superfamily N-acetyltransferase
MDPVLSLTVERVSAAADMELVKAGLAAYNRLHVEDDNHADLNVFARDGAGAIVGGLLGGTYWGWMHVGWLWVAEARRGAGLGGRLLRAAEEEALRRGCPRAHLETHDFQAMDFYRRRGYALFGEQKDCPPGHVKYYLAKALTEG